MKIKTFLFLSSIIINQLVLAQKEATWWYFGTNAGISFTGSGGTPVAQTNGKTNSLEGAATISNANGGLLFYTDGESVYNKSHNVMTNGTGLKGHTSSTQSAVIVQQPVRGNRYYIFTTGEEWNTNGFQYSIVDTAIGGGQGQVISKNNTLLSKCAEKVAAVKHANKEDTWIVSHTPDNNSFYVYKLSSFGVSSPVVSSVGPTWASSGAGAKGYAKGYLKFSPDGTKLVAAIAGNQSATGGGYTGNAGRIEVYDFNNITGAISNPQIIDKNNKLKKAGIDSISGVYGVEFSANSRFLYVGFYMPAAINGGDGNNGIWQIDLKRQIDSTMGASIVRVAPVAGAAFGGMQLAPDGKIYIARLDQTYLSCIQKPNCKGAACSFVNIGITLSGRKCQFGIPNFINSFVKKAEFDWVDNSEQLCENSLTKFYVPDSTGIDSARWNFGDPSTGSLNKATGFTVYHKFSSSKTYSVFVQLFRNKPSSDCYADTIRRKLTIFPKPKPYLGNDTAICKGEEVLLSDTTSGATFIWKDNSIISSYIANTKGWYWVDTKVGGCTGRDSVYLDFLPSPKFSLGRDTFICNYNSLKLSAADGKKYLWSTGDTAPSIVTKDTGIFWARAFNGNCYSYDTIKIKNVVVAADFGIPVPVQCFKNNLFAFKETSIYKGDKRKQSVWYFYDGSTIIDSFAKRTFPNPGTYSIKLISHGIMGCKDSITKTVKVYPQTQLGFNINDSLQCLNGNSFDFINTTQDTGKISYQWDLGNKTFSNSKDVADKIYLKDTMYRIGLITTNAYNCKDTLTKTIKVLANPKADFNSGIACNATPVKFEYKGTKPVILFEWDLNKEGTSTIEHPTKLFSTIGTKKITLIITSINGCTDTLIKNVVVKQQPKADFTVDDICETDNAKFINRSQGGHGFIWRFGDGKIDTGISPKHFYKISGWSQSFNVTLAAIDSNRCSDSITKTITVNANPDSDFSFTRSGKKVDFTARTGLTKYRWLFNTGDSAVTTKSNYSDTFTNINTLYVCLKVTNAAGCVSETCKYLVTQDVNSIDRPTGILIFPNPNKGSFNLSIENPEKDISIDIYNLLGEKIKSFETSDSKTLYKIDLNVSNGMYIVRVKNGEIIYYQNISINN